MPFCRIFLSWMFVVFERQAFCLSRSHFRRPAHIDLSFNVLVLFTDTSNSQLVVHFNLREERSIVNQQLDSAIFESE